MSITKSKYKFFYIAAFTLVILIVSLVIYFQPSDDYTVTFVSAGQGDSAVIKGKNSTVLIDAGTRKSAVEVRAALDRLNVKRIDLVILSHYDSDHISGMYNIINKFEVGKIAAPKTESRYLPDSSSFDELMTAAENKNVPIIKVKYKDRIKLSGIDIDVLSPAKEYGDSNEDSAVVRLKCGSNKLLFSGDISSSVEKDILINNKDISADILKVAHHGSRTSTSSEFLTAVNPSYAAVSVSRYNSYNLPNLETMKRLYGYGCEVYRTDEMGNITFHLNGGKITAEVEKS